MSKLQRIVITLFVFIVVAYFVYQPSDVSDKNSQQQTASQQLYSADNNVGADINQSVLLPALASDNLVDTKLAIQKYPIEMSPECEKRMKTMVDELEAHITSQLSVDELDELIALTGEDSFKRVVSESEEYQKKQEELTRKRLELLESQYIATKDELVGIMILEICSDVPVTENCNERTVNAIFNDHGYNGYLWFYTPLWTGEKDKSELIEKIISSNGINTFRYEHIKKTYHQLTDFGIKSFPALLTSYGVSFAWRNFPYSPVYDYCKTNHYPEACLKLGKYMETAGQDALIQGIGLNIQENYWEGKDSEMKKETTNRKTELMAQYQELHSFPSFIMSDEMVQSHLIALDYEHEIDFATYLYKESKRILSNDSSLCAY